MSRGPSTRSLTTRTRVYSLFSPLFSFHGMKILYDLYRLLCSSLRWLVPPEIRPRLRALTNLRT